MWVFGYGSLLWDPGFPVEHRIVARLNGWARSFCMRSVHHRGSAEVPGLVLALDAAAGSVCEGLALEVASGHEGATLAYLRERELISSAYLEKTLSTVLEDGRVVPALVYVIDPEHVQYCGGLPLEEQARIIATARGGRGPNSEYLFNTVAYLNALGLDDPQLVWLCNRVSGLIS